MLAPGIIRIVAINVFAYFWGSDLINQDGMPSLKKKQPKNKRTHVCSSYRMREAARLSGLLSYAWVRKSRWRSSREGRRQVSSEQLQVCRSARLHLTLHIQSCDWRSVCGMLWMLNEATYAISNCNSWPGESSRTWVQSLCWLVVFEKVLRQHVLPCRVTPHQLSNASPEMLRFGNI